jgi:hypothetical protein
MHCCRILAICVAATPAYAADASYLRSLARLDPQTRLEQVCDVAAMDRIRRDTQFSPDRAKSSITREPTTDGHTLIAKGAAFRSNGRWYELSFVCKGTPDHMAVASFAYRIGKVIPEARWQEYGLWR